MAQTISPLLTGLVLGWLTLAAALALMILLRSRWRSRRYGVPVDHGVMLVAFGRRMTGTLDVASLGELMTVDVPRALRVERSTLLLPEGHQLVTVGRQLGQEDGLRLPVSHAAVRWVASGGEAQLSQRGRLHELVQQGPVELAWTDVWVPLMRGAELRGMWLLGRPAHGLRFGPEDLRYLTSLARQAAAVLEASRHADQERRTAGELRSLYRQVVTAQEVERSRLARELHDGVLQDLCAVVRDLKAMETQGESDNNLDLVVERSGDTVQALRAICSDLRPPLLEHDLVSALKALVEGLDARSTTPVHIEVSADGLKVSDEVALVLFRITQEALNNAIRHADASEIAVRLTQFPDRLRLTIIDDGQGIQDGVDPARFVAQGHFGVAGMRERAAMIGGKLEIQTALDYGTVVIFEMPHG